MGIDVSCMRMHRSRRAKSSLTLALNAFADRSPAEIKQRTFCC
jgi:hypothetical protein